MMNSLSPANLISLPSPTPEAAPASAEPAPAFVQALDRATQAQRSADKADDQGAGDNTAAAANIDDHAARTPADKRSRNVTAATPRDMQGRAAPTSLPIEDELCALDSPATDRRRDTLPGDDAASAMIDLAALMSGLAAAARPPREADTADQRSGTEHTDTIDAPTGRDTHAPRRAHGNGHDELALQESGQTPTTRPGLDRQTGASIEAMAANLRQHDAFPQGHSLDNTASNPNSMAPAAAASTAASPRAAATAAQFQGELAAALGTPEFASALGTQVSVLVRDGVSHAQLHLNPADMGPVSVHIRLDGNSAQVDFSALQALTRQALEDAVPALASALRESGLTLSGGGVFEQPRQPDSRDARQAETSAPRGGGRVQALVAAPDAPPLHGAISRAARARGMVDLYA